MKSVLSMLVMAALCVSCQKQAEPVQADQKVQANQKVQLDRIAALGFDASKATILSPDQASDLPALHFESLAQAQLYFKKMKSHTTREGDRNSRFRSDAVDLTGIEGIISTNKLEDEQVYIQVAEVPGGASGGGWFGAPPSWIVTIRDWQSWNGYQVSFTYATGSAGQPTSVTDFKSTYIGFTPSMSYDHDHGSAYTSGYWIYFTVSGFQKVNIVWEGLGTLFTIPVTIQGKYNTKTGQFKIES
jgi:hypothetical protein